MLSVSKNRQCLKPEKRIHPFFMGNGGGDGRRALCAQHFSLTQPVLSCGILRFARAPETDIGEGIFVRAVHARHIWQGGELVQRSEHLPRRSFKKPPAAACEQGIAAEKARRSVKRIRKQKSNMSQRMP